MNDKKQMSQKSSFPVASLTLGIISIVASFFWYISLPTGILAIVFGAKSIKKTGSKIAKAGLITGIIGVSVMLFIYITLAIVIVLTNL